ncbi:T9SS type A sorting domain-containing protein [Aureisphaera galaxeae]|uniref:T9SS type A sorting domain-containing protein n=1 Tax=Aureisphaera galaxeae TaxID=1538023 RepID=UPI002350719B|nr:T9SS type A sorting domain-containing protein [Aureisphaera galaxeae]MDC8002802.1 T9SS type A sorting domain-containing protein [Aureisphaera galaxeae]
MKYVFSFLGFMMVATLFGQQAQRTNVGMSGGSYTVVDGESQLYVSQSIGQGGIIGSSQGSEYGVRQGFQQPPIRVVSVSQSDNPLSAVVFPNPVVTSVTVKFGESVQGTIKGKLFDVSGKEIFYQEYEPVQALSVDLSHLPAGTYILVIAAQGKQFTSRLIKN